MMHTIWAAILVQITSVHLQITQQIRAFFNCDCFLNVAQDLFICLRFAVAVIVGWHFLYKNVSFIQTLIKYYVQQTYILYRIQTLCCTIRKSLPVELSVFSLSIDKTNNELFMKLIQIESAVCMLQLPKPVSNRIFSNYISVHKRERITFTVYIVYVECRIDIN